MCKGGEEGSLPGERRGHLRPIVLATARNKFAPMVRGLFPRIEHQPVLAVLEQSVVFLTPGSIEGLIRGEGFLSTAWQLANIYLAGIGAGRVPHDPDRSSEPE